MWHNGASVLKVCVDSLEDHLAATGQPLTVLSKHLPVAASLLVPELSGTMPL